MGISLPKKFHLKTLSCHDKYSPPARWSGQTRNWQPIGEVWLNPDKNLEIIQQEKTLEAA